ncbi:alpha-amylase family protein [Paenibacillus piri]|nr:alpha-amylase family protein [Paenibacillus piri]
MGDKKQWYQKQLRIVQTVLREPDVVNYDAEGVVRYMEEVHANCIVINGGGIIDFFRHDLATANPNSFMTNEDILKDLTEACHRKGMKVIVRVDFRGVDKRIYDLHPDWFAVNEKGEPMFWANLSNIPNPLYAPCYLSYYRNEHAFQFSDILFERYGIDGIWENAPFQNGVCYCESCRDSYRNDRGKELPRGGEFSDRSYDEYRAWKAGNLNRHLEDYRERVKRHGDDKIYCAEIFGLFYDHYKGTSSDLYQVKDHFDFLVTPLFTANHEALHAPSTLMKFLNGLEPDKTPVMLFGHLGTNNELRYVSSSAAETRIWMWQAVSAGGSLWNCIFNGQHPGATYDRRNALLSQDVYSYMEQYEELLNDQQPAADVSIYYSRNSNNIFNNGDRTKDAYITHLIGLEQALIANKLQYDFVLDQNATDEALSKVKCLVIPNGACLSDEEIERIKRYVYNGGRLLSTFETSLYDPDGTPRNNLALADVFGCSFTGIKKDCSQYGYQYVRGSHPMTKGFEQTQLLANWGVNLLVKPNAGVECPITYVPKIYPQSPERAWPRSFETEFPTCVVNRYGKGTSVYLPYGVDRHVWMHGHHDFKTVLRNAFQYLLDERQLIESTAPASVQFQLNRIKREPGCYLLHAINTTSAPSRPVQEIIALHNLEVEVRLQGSEAEALEILHADGEVKLLDAAVQENGQVKLRIGISRLNEYCGICIRIK